MVLRLSAEAEEAAIMHLSNFLLQRNMVVVSAIIENDLKNMGFNNIRQEGYNKATGSSFILFADSNGISFKTDLTPDDGPNEDIITYKEGDLVQYTENPRDRYLERIVNGKRELLNVGLTELRFAYYDVSEPTKKLNFPITSPGNIGPIEVSIKLETPDRMHPEYSVDTSQYEMYWRQFRIMARRLLLQR